MLIAFRSTEVEQSILEDLRNRVQLSSVALPSVSFYTFINTHNGYPSSFLSVSVSSFSFFSLYVLAVDIIESDVV